MIHFVEAENGGLTLHVREASHSFTVHAGSAEDVAAYVEAYGVASDCACGVSMNYADGYGFTDEGGANHMWGYGCMLADGPMDDDCKNKKELEGMSMSGEERAWVIAALCLMLVLVSLVLRAHMEDRMVRDMVLAGASPMEAKCGVSPMSNSCGILVATNAMNAAK